MRSTKAMEQLTQAGYRNTGARESVLDFLGMQHYLIHREMIQEATGLDPTSIYRVLDVLEKLHIIRKIHSNSTYVTIPESLRADEHIAIYIDESTHSIDIKALNAVRDDDFSLSASHIELRGTGSKYNTDNHLNKSDNKADNKLSKTDQESASEKSLNLSTHTNHKISIHQENDTLNKEPTPSIQSTVASSQTMAQTHQSPQKLKPFKKRQSKKVSGSKASIHTSTNDSHNHDHLRTIERLKRF